MRQIPSLWKRKYFRRLVRTYLVILAILCVVYLVTYTTLLGIIKTEREKTNSYILVTVKMNIDNKILQLNQMLNQLATDNEVYNYMSSDSFSNANDFQDYNSKKYLQKILVNNQNLVEIYLYKSGVDKIVSSSVVESTRDFFVDRHRSDGYEYEEWMQFINETHDHQFFTLPRTNRKNTNESYIAFAQTISIDAEKNSKLTAILLLDEEALIGSAMTSGGLDLSQFFIIDKDENVLLHYGDEEYNHEILSEYVDQSRKSILNTFYNDTSIINVVYSDLGHWKYLITTPKELYFASLNKLTTVFVCCVLLYFIGGLIAVVLLAKKNYKPFEFLLEEFTKEDIEYMVSQEYDEFSLIFDKINSLYSKNKELELNNQNSIIQLKEKYLKEVLEDSVKCEMLIQSNMMDSCGIEPISDKFAIVLIQVENLMEISQEGNAALSDDLIRYAITNVFTELVAMQKCEAYSVTIQSDKQAFLINFYKEINAERATEMLNQVINDTRSFFSKHYYARLSFAVSSLERTLQEIHLSYKEAMEAMGYSIVMGKGRTIFYSEITEKKDQYIYDANVEKMLINSIGEKDYESSKKIIDEFFTHYVYSEEYTLGTIRAYIFDMARILLRALPKQKVVRIENLLTETAKETHQKMLMALENYCAESDDKQRILLFQVKRYINDNFHNPELNSDFLGEQFGFSAPYLSKLFKEEFHESILNYLHKKRIEEAKRLLLTEKVKLEKLAETVGYLNADSFGRTFKKYEGITPGQFRQKNRHKQS